MAIVARDDAGPHDQRYVATFVASLRALFLALRATTASALLGVLPIGFVTSRAGLALLSALMGAPQKTVLTELPMGASFALAIGASPLTILCIGSAFPALVGGLLVSLVLERPALLQSRRSAQT